MLRSFEQVRLAAADRLLAAEADYAAIAGSGEYAMPWHWHDCLMFILPSQGTIELKHDGPRAGAWLSSNCFAVVPPGRPHQTQAGLGAHSHVAIYVTGPHLDRLESELGSLSEFRRRTRTPSLFRPSPALRALQRLSTQAPSDGFGRSRILSGLSTALLIQSMADVIASETVLDASRREHGRRLVEDLKEYLAAHAYRPVPLDGLEDRFGVSRRHITRLFREFTGMSVGDFQQQTRIRTACDLLAATDLPVGEVACRAGFDSGSALARAMRRVDGRSPSQVRKGAARSIKN